jgi:hypothetical protein
MRDTDVLEFEERLNSLECSDNIRSIVVCLRNEAERAGDDVSTLSHLALSGGWGIRFKRGRAVFCRLDPKPSAEHVCVCIPAAEERVLSEAGTVHRRKNAWSWVDISDMRGAELLKNEIRLAYGRAGVSLKR